MFGGGGGKMRPENNTDDLKLNYELSAQTMWEPRRLTTQQAYKDCNLFFFALYLFAEICSLFVMRCVLWCVVRGVLFCVICVFVCDLLYYHCNR
jgi:hypothetical protein